MPLILYWIKYILSDQLGPASINTQIKCAFGVYIYRYIVFFFPIVSEACRDSPLTSVQLSTGSSISSSYRGGVNHKTHSQGHNLITATRKVERSADRNKCDQGLECLQSCISWWLSFNMYSFFSYFPLSGQWFLSLPLFVANLSHWL